MKGRCAFAGFPFLCISGNLLVIIFFSFFPPLFVYFSFSELSLFKSNGIAGARGIHFVFSVLSLDSRWHSALPSAAPAQERNGFRAAPCQNWE